ncbi:beta-ketoacyl synthase chain length factor [Vibrio gallicus]|uniref:beta-ketoacyl synthase chain length factor n=1 Tax=Vibrio gallicus TaxID=190897 RepID=UPI0021C4568E|nr:beta-ketoacyl synthase chain length factor [Vibrio gallicus]
MSNNTLSISFNLEAWRANAKGLYTAQQWIDWAQSQQCPADGKIQVSNIPPMMRRRMSNLSKYAVQVALELLKEHDVDYIVFASRHGELERSVQLIEDIVQGEDASPIAFSQSVHNTAAGLTTIAAKKAIAVTSIAAADNTFQMALLEAYAYLNLNPEHKVLFVDFDEPVPDCYAIYEPDSFIGFGFGCILSKGEQLSAHISKLDTCDSLPQGLEFLRHFLLDEPSWTISSANQTWQWQRA